jgi:hypothetical protein
MDDKYKNEFGWFAPRPQVEKKFYDGKYIFAGLIVFVALVALPFLPNVGKTIPPPERQLDTPVIQKMAKKDRKCIMPTEWMRANHMQMLINWRDGVVRTDEQGAPNGRYFVAPDGKKYLASLTNSCLDCHSNKDKFCDQCHNYVAVAPNCWGCHLPQGKKLAEAK